VALVRTGVSGNRIASIIKVKRISERGTTSVFTNATRHHIPEDGIIHSHRRAKLKSYIDLFEFSGALRETPTLLGPLERFDLLVTFAEKKLSHLIL
jgi:hypothetical protein